MNRAGTARAVHTAATGERVALPGRQRGADGAAGLTRTDDLTLTKRLLYQLSYSGTEGPTKESGILPPSPINT